MSINRIFPPPTVASALSGFVVGVFLTLLATGVMSRGSKTPSTPPSTLPPSTPVADVLLKSRIQRIVLRQLGPAYPHTRQARLINVYLQTPVEDVGPSPIRRPLTNFKSVFISFRLNDNPLPGQIWRFRTAQAEIFAVLKALYTAQLPIYNVELDGYFPLRDQNGQTKDHLALVAYLDHTRAERIPWKRWTRLDEHRLWLALTYSWTDHRFA